jgi:hypothetical protein
MYTNLATILTPVSGRYMTRLRLFIEMLHRKLNASIDRAANVSFDGYGSRILANIIKQSDVESFLRTSESLQSFYTRSSQDAARLEKLIDPRIGLHSTAKMFIRSKTPCFELMAPIRTDVDPPTDKPLSDPSWDAIRPFRMIDAGHCDYVVTFSTNYLTFQHRGPAYAVYGVDVNLLVTKFAAYCRYHGVSNSIDDDIYRFLRDHGVLPYMVDDFTSIWVRNMWRSQLITGSPLEDFTTTMWDAVGSIGLPAELKAALFDVRHLREDLISGAATPRYALSSLLVDMNEDSFSSYLGRLFSETKSSPIYHFKWLECIKYLSYIEFILVVTSLNPSNLDSVRFRQGLRVDTTEWLAARPWNAVKLSVPFSAMVELKVRGMRDYLERGV